MNYVGVDVSKAVLDVADDVGNMFQVTNDPAGHSELVNRVLGSRLVVMEGSGRHECAAAAALAAKRIPVAIVNPKQVRDFAKAFGVLAKTDNLDAKVLVQFAIHVKPPAQVLPDDATREFEALLVRRGQLVEMRSAEMNRRHLADKSVHESLDQHIQWLSAQINDVDRDLDKRLRDSPLWLKRAKILQSMKGIGPQTSRALLAHLPELGILSGKKIAALGGLAPFNDDSGARQGRRHIKGGRGAVRSALYMSAVSAATHNPVFRAFYAKLRAKGKEHNVAITAVMRRMLEVLNAMLATNREWDPALAMPKSTL